MVDIGAKSDVVRVARAEGLIKLSPSTVKLVVEGRVEKGDVFT
ncbi:MAG: cyclic pyranopterin monophosphate synthase MoaC, partial [Sulfolobales archaeon]